MKKHFIHNKKVVQSREQYDDYNEAYDWDSIDDSYAEEEFEEDGNSEDAEAAFYEDEEDFEAGEEVYYETDGYIEDNNEIDYEYEEYEEYEEYIDDYAFSGFDGVNEQSEKTGFLAKLGSTLRGMEAMDRVMLVTGAGVLALAVAICSVLIGNRTTEKQISDFRSVGTQIEGITVIGEYGLAAVSNEEAAKLEAARMEVSAEPSEAPGKEYDEKDYDKQVSVEPEFISIQRDLKIKFINSKTSKLVANVPFSVTIADPEGGTQIWSDDDMDGIIMKKDITPGTYKITLETLADEKYANYILSTVTRTVEVKKEISYAKVDVSNEVKTEAEVNAAEEDTKKNETVVESSLQDTVAWVESQVIGAVYNEVLKSTIPDPAAIVRSGTVFGAGVLTMVDEEIVDPTAEPTADPPMDPPMDPVMPPASPSPVPTADPAPVVTPVPVKGTLTVDEAFLTVAAGASLTAKATAAGFAEGSVIVYSVVSDAPLVAAAAIDQAGNISVTGIAAGTAVLTVTANYENGGEETEASADITVVVGDHKAITLDKTEFTVFIGTPAVITAQITNAFSQDPMVTAESSDANVAAVTADKMTVTITGLSAGTAVITVTYTENNEIVSAACTVTVKNHPSEDRENLLKNADGEQVYVMDNNVYREAVFADYYTADMFFLKGSAKYTGWQTIDGKVYYYNAGGEAVTGEQVIQGARYNFASDGSLIVGDGVAGIDVSKWNGNINWNTVKNSGVSYVIIRCGYRGSSQGQLIVDSKFEANIKGATGAGLKVGIYFFSQAVDEAEAVEEASMVLEQIKNYTISYPVFVDVEASGGRGDQIDRETRTAVCEAFCQTIKNGGYTAGVYSNKIWLENKINAGSLSGYKIWLAQYAETPTYAGKYDLWQYRSTGSVSGISGNVDMNISYLGY